LQALAASWRANLEAAHQRPARLAHRRDTHQTPRHPQRHRPHGVVPRLPGCSPNHRASFRRQRWRTSQPLVAP
jgi:hypothetical protein